MNYREEANNYAQERNKLYQESQEEYKKGNGQKAKELSEKAKEMDKLMKSSNKKAEEAIIKPQKINQSGIIDLHGLYLSEAINIIKQILKRKKKLKFKELKIITGLGNHSHNNIPKIKPAIIKILDEKKYKYKINKGEIILYLK